MFKVSIIVVFILLFCGCSSQSQEPSLLSKAVYFPHESGQMTKMHLRSDSLFTFHSNAIGMDELTGIYKVVRINRPSEIEIFNGELIEDSSIMYRRKPVQKSMSLVFKQNGPDKIVLIGSGNYKSKSNLDSFMDSVNITSAYGMTFYSRKFFESFNTLKEVTTKDDVAKIMETLKSDRAEKTVEAFKKQGLIDMYATTLKSELINQACLEFGYNPIKASSKVNQIMRD